MAKFSINVSCDCGAKMTFTPPSDVHAMPERLRHFDLKCGYCGCPIGWFHTVLSKEFKGGE